MTSYNNYYKHFNDIIKSSISDLHEIIKSDFIKETIPKIRGNDMYDYSDVKEVITVEQFKKYDMPLLDVCSHEEYNKFISMRDDEKIIKVESNFGRYASSHYLLLTNHAKLMFYNFLKLVSSSYAPESYVNCVTKDYNFLIPKDYINIIKNLQIMYY